jgi:hypothetical protein
MANNLTPAEEAEMIKLVTAAAEPGGSAMTAKSHAWSQRAKAIFLATSTDPNLICQWPGSSL